MPAQKKNVGGSGMLAAAAIMADAQQKYKQYPKTLSTSRTNIFN